MADEQAHAESFPSTPQQRCLDMNENLLVPEAHGHHLPIQRDYGDEDRE